MARISWESKLATVAKGKAAAIEKALGYRTVGELLLHLPRRYVTKGDLSDAGSLVVGDHLTVVGEVVRATPHQYVDRRTGRPAHRLEAVVRTTDQSLLLTFFDKSANTARWRAGKLVPGTHGLFSGKVGTFRGQWQLTNPKMQLFSSDTADTVDSADTDEPGGADATDSALLSWASRPGLLPIYPASASVESWQIERAVAVALDLVEDVPELVPAEVAREHGLLSTRKALQWIHRPESEEERRAAERTLRFQEALVLQLVLARRRLALDDEPALARPGSSGGVLDAFDDRLPFRLTEGQTEVGRQIGEDLGRSRPMHRLLQGEVGSGKTVVALRAMLQVVDSGGQAALLAPTEVLAQQHHRSITAMLGDLAAEGMLGGAEQATRVVLLTGSTPAAARRRSLLEAASGEAGIVVGTHALLEDRVQFADLGLVVVDEQHRFGVEQRAALAAKAGETRPHVLVMTATPIPRTVAMTVFGDLETSTLSELPAGRAPVQTNVVPVGSRPAWLDRAWARIREEVGQGRQAYVVCPRVERAEDDEPEAPASVREVAPSLAAGPLAGLRVQPLHGRMPPDEKDSVMQGFGAGEVDVLVATTVIEVGVDVPNATVMVVLDADRFGVSQLHQLRGRVGRGGHPGLCLLVTRAAPGSRAAQRLDAVAATTDGFEIARVDLEQRREGDVLGSAQSGMRSGLRLLSVLEHEDEIVTAREVATRLVAQGRDLASHPALAAAVRRFEEAERVEYLDKT